MRLLIVTHYFWPENFRVNDLVTELVKRGHEVTVLTGPPNYPSGSIFPEYAREPARYLDYGGAQVVRVPLVPRGRTRARLLLNYMSAAISASIVGSWRLRGRQFDAIFVYEPSPVTIGIPGILLGRLKRAPVALWVLDLWPETLVALGVVRSPALLATIAKLVSLIYNRCDLILAQSRSFVQQIARHCNGKRRVAYFPSWAEAMFDANDALPAPEVPTSPGSFDVMFAGNIGEAQDFPAILAAADKLKGNARIRWLIVGDGSVAPWVREQIARRGLQDSVLMLGRFPVDRMPSLYQHADALLVSLKDEPIFALTIPGKLQSYLAAGVPVVAMLNGEGADVVARAECGIACAAGDSDSLAAAVLRLASMPDERLSEMRRNALAASAREFNRSKLISQLESWLEQLKAGNRGELLELN